MQTAIEIAGINGPMNYLAAVAVFAAGAGAVKIGSGIFDKKVKTFLDSRESWISGFAADVTGKNVLAILYFAAFYLAANTLYLSPKVARVVDVAGLVVLSFYAARVATLLLDNLIANYRPEGKDKPLGDEIPKGLKLLIKAAVWGLVAVFLLDNLGFDITALVAGVGIGGIAIAMASQAILGDLFSFVVILFDKPFKKGDYIVIGDKSGSVEKIGIKTTRLRALTGEEMVFSNTDLTNSRVHNYRKMEKRRVAFSLGVAYETPSDKVKKIPGLMQGIIEGIDDTVFGRAHFASYGDSALMFDIVYYVNTSDYDKYMDIQQEINLGVKEEFEKLGAELAYPTQTVYLKRERD